MCCLAVLQAGRPRSRCGQLCFPPRPLSSACSWLPFPCGLTGLSSLRASPLMFLRVLSASSNKHTCQTGLGPSLILTQLPVQRPCLQVQLPSDVWRVETKDQEADRFEPTTGNLAGLGESPFSQERCVPCSFPGDKTLQPEVPGCLACCRLGLSHLD